MGAVKGVGAVQGVGAVHVVLCRRVGVVQQGECCSGGTVWGCCPGGVVLSRGWCGSDGYCPGGDVLEVVFCQKTLSILKMFIHRPNLRGQSNRIDYLSYHMVMVKIPNI